MHHYSKRAAFFAAFSLSLIFSSGVQAECCEVPPPTFNGVEANASVSFDDATKLYTYGYEVRNGSTSTGNIGNLFVDVAWKYSGNEWYDGTRASNDSDQELTIDLGSVTKGFHEVLSDRYPLQLPPNKYMVPFGLALPQGWVGGMTRDGYAMVSANSDVAEVQPGDTTGGLKVITPGVPVIKEIVLQSFWVPNFPDDPSPEEMKDAPRPPDVRLKTLSPSGTDALNWSTLKKEIQEAVDLGWIQDKTLVNQVNTKLDTANKLAIEEEDGTAAKQELNALLSALEKTSSGISQQGRDLVRLNVEALIRKIPDTPIPVKPAYSLEPGESTHSTGEEVTLIATVVNAAYKDKPLSGFDLRFIVDEGPNQFTRGRGVTNENGKATFSYRGAGVGTDKVHLRRRLRLSSTGEFSARDLSTSEHQGVKDVALVHWEGGPDLSVIHFIPPLIEAKGGDTVKVTDLTSNLGDEGADASVTRYYLSEQAPTEAPELPGLPGGYIPPGVEDIGQRQVPALEPGDEQTTSGVELQLPGDLEEGEYHIFACADATEDVGETDERNNCSYNEVEGITSITVGITQERPNSPPECSEAVPSTGELLWPPNHKFRSVSIEGVTDPNGDDVFVTISGIQQDEPVETRGSGKTKPDGAGIGTSTAKLRAERAGPKEGRLYFVEFEAEDELGATCEGTVTVGVPHDRSAKGLPKDTGERFESTTK